MRKYLHSILSLLVLCTFYAIGGGSAVAQTDELTASNFAATGTTYKNFSYTSSTTSVTYFGNSAKSSKAGDIQLRSKNSNSGIIANSTSLKLVSITVEWDTETDVTSTDRTIDIYANTTAYTGEDASALYSSSSATQGTKIGSIVCGTSTTYEVTDGSEYSYIGIRSNNGALYAKSITFVWEAKSGTTKDDAGLSYGETTTYTAYVGQSFTAPTLTNPNNLTVSYESSEKSVATVDASTGEVTLVGAGETTITASSEATDGYSAGSATYTLTVVDNTVYEGLAAIKNLYTSAGRELKVKLTDAVVTYVNGSNVLIEDATGGALIYISNNSFKAGQKITGEVAVTATLYKSSTKELTKFDTSSATVTEDAEIPCTTLTAEEVASNVDRYENCRVKVVDATVTSALANRNATIEQNGTELIIFAKVKNTALPLDLNTVVDVVGYPTTYNCNPQLGVWEISDVTVKAVTIATTTDEGYGTTYSEYAYVMPEGVKGTTITAADAEGNLTTPWEYTSGKTVPAKTALLLLGDANKTYTATIAADDTQAAPTTNLLHGADAVDSDGNTYVDGTSVKYYILSYNAEGANLGFYWAAEDGAAITYQAPYAFLAIEGTQAARGYAFGNGATAISTVTTNGQAAQAIYTLSGVRVNSNLQSLPKGLYIVGGKKVIIK